MAAVLLTTDLMVTSLATGAATATGVPLRTVGSVSELLTSAKDPDTKLVVLDLALRELKPDDVVFELKSLKTCPKVLAFGQHVHEARLNAARQAGCDQVLTRGQFCAQLADVLRAMAA